MQRLPFLLLLTLLHKHHAPPQVGWVACKLSIYSVYWGHGIIRCGCVQRVTGHGYHSPSRVSPAFNTAARPPLLKTIDTLSFVLLVPPTASLESPHRQIPRQTDSSSAVRCGQRGGVRMSAELAVVIDMPVDREQMARHMLVAHRLARRHGKTDVGV